MTRAKLQLGLSISKIALVYVTVYYFSSNRIAVAQVAKEVNAGSDSMVFETILQTDQLCCCLIGFPHITPDDDSPIKMFSSRRIGHNGTHMNSKCVLTVLYYYNLVIISQILK